MPNFKTNSESTKQDVVDLFIIGGGVNGCGIARDAVGRGLSVTLAEKADLGGATSSASTKMFHGGLRYLEFFKVRLVKEALVEREILLRAMPHISWPMRFVLPYHKDMRFEGETSVSRLLKYTMPWLKGRRPAWLIRIGLFVYDHLGGREILPATTSLKLENEIVGDALNSKFRKAFEYSDCWVQDSRLVVLNARDAADRGALIMTRTQVLSAERKGGIWEVVVKALDSGKENTHYAKALVNASGPWVENVIKNIVRVEDSAGVRLVRGSHIVTKKLYEHKKAYFLQGVDGRIIFVLPFEDDFTLIGTTDQDYQGGVEDISCDADEVDYLCNFVSDYFKKPINKHDVVWSYSGVRPLYNDGAKSATSATRDYVLVINQESSSLESKGAGAPLLNIYGGKITTYRRLAESALKKLSLFFPELGPNWTAGASLPGGDFGVDEVELLIENLNSKYPFLGEYWAKRLIRTYGTEADLMLAGASSKDALGIDFGGSLTEVEVNWLLEKEFVYCAEDVLWRRTKLGLRLNETQKNELQNWITNRLKSQINSVAAN